MAKTSRGIEIPDAELNARKWGQSGKGLARINDQGSIEVYDEQPGLAAPSTAPTPRCLASLQRRRRHPLPPAHRDASNSGRARRQRRLGDGESVGRLGDASSLLPTAADARTEASRAVGDAAATSPLLVDRLY
jgi:hypothetical protein